MPTFAVLLLGIAGAVMLCFGADGLVRGGAALARAVGVPALVIGLTVVAFGTSAPELVVSVDAARRGAGGIAIGNVVGSNICNIALILGASALVRPLPANRALFKLDLPAMVVSSILLALWCGISGGVGRRGGGLFCLLLAGYLAKRFYNARHDEDEAAALAGEAAEGRPMRWPAAALLTAVSCLMLVFGAKFFVAGAVRLAELLRVSDAVIGLTVVALGTSLPELATGIAAARRGECDIAIGNVVGSNLFNVLCILGIAPLFSPLGAGGVTRFDWAVMCGMALLLCLMMKSSERISRLEGGGLLALYALYILKLALWPEWGK